MTTEQESAEIRESKPSTDPDESEKSEAKSGDSLPLVNPAVAGLTYEGLFQRANTTTMIRWQTLGLGLTAQGFVVGAASQIQNLRLPTAIMLTIVILFIGLTTVVTGQRFELTAMADRYMLDAYEERLLGEGFGDLKLHHSVQLTKRPSAMLYGTHLAMYQDRSNRRGAHWIVNNMARVGPNYWWVTTQLVISIAGAAIPLLRYFGW